MIRYQRTEWYGVQYLFRLSGSTLPRCLPAVLYAMGSAVFFSSGVVDRAGWPIRDFFGHPYAMQLLGLVFGYLSIARLQMSYSRYWEGIQHIKIMHSNWTSACLQLMAFDRVVHSDRASLQPDNGDAGGAGRGGGEFPGRAGGGGCGASPSASPSQEVDPFIAHLARLFKQLSALCIVELHADDGVLGTWTPGASLTATDERKSRRRHSSVEQYGSGGCGGDGAAVAGGSVPGAGLADRDWASFAGPLGGSGGGAAAGGGRDVDSSVHGGPGVSLHSQHQFKTFNDLFDSVFSTVHDSRGDHGKLGGRHGGWWWWWSWLGGGTPSAEQLELTTRRRRQRHGMRQLMQEAIPGAEEFYMRSPSAPTACLSRILRALSTRQLAGGMSAPSPMVARALQDLSKGFESYHSATKMKEVPVPFAYVQVNALLLIVFNLITPIAIASFSSPDAGPAPTDDAVPLALLSYNRTMHCLVAALLSAVVVAGFTAMWLVANELEDPFGSDANDIDVLSYHERFCEALEYTVCKPWLYEDHWIVPAGEWVSPDSNWSNVMKEEKRQKWRRMSQIAELAELQETLVAEGGWDGDEDAMQPTKERPPRPGETESRAVVGGGGGGGGRVGGMGRMVGDPSRFTEFPALQKRRTRTRQRVQSPSPPRRGAGAAPPSPLVAVTSSEGTPEADRTGQESAGTGLQA